MKYLNQNRLFYTEIIRQLFDKCFIESSVSPKTPELASKNVSRSTEHEYCWKESWKQPKQQ